LAAVSFSKVTVADWVLAFSLVSGVTEREEILPLRGRERLLAASHQRWFYDVVRTSLEDGKKDVPEAEEVTDFLLGGLASDVLDVDGGGHDCGVM
jgi:hypothetical protein